MPQFSDRLFPPLSLMMHVPDSFSFSKLFRLKSICLQTPTSSILIIHFQHKTTVLSILHWTCTVTNSNKSISSYVHISTTRCILTMFLLGMQLTTEKYLLYTDLLVPLSITNVGIPYMQCWCNSKSSADFGCDSW